MKEIILTKGKTALVDDDDYAEISAFRWNLNGKYAGRSYMRNGRLTTMYMHRQIMGPPPGMQIDHINGNRLDNRRANLRVVTQQENAYNKHAPWRQPCSGYRGVYPDNKGGRWRAVLYQHDKIVYRAIFDTALEAARARDAAARAIYGEYAYLNFPDDGHRKP